MYEEQEFGSFFAESESLDEKPMQATIHSAPVRACVKVRVHHQRIKIRAYRRRVCRAPDRQWCSPIRINAPPVI